MPRLLLTIAYDGRPFAGWQIQPNANTVQAEVEKAIFSLTKQQIRIHGAGRTDTGVHADGQRAHFDTPENSKMTAANWQRAINTRLPGTIRIVECAEVHAEFHARYSATAKHYCYTLYLGQVLPPRLAGWTWHIPQLPLDRDMIIETVSKFTGHHDFRQLSSRRGNEPDPLPEDFFKRELFDCHVEVRHQHRYDLHFHGEGFLYKMVRYLTGAAVECAMGRLQSNQLEQILKGESGTWQNPKCAPPQGLSLIEVSY